MNLLPSFATVKKNNLIADKKRMIIISKVCLKQTVANKADMRQYVQCY